MQSLEFMRIIKSTLCTVLLGLGSITLATQVSAATILQGGGITVTEVDNGFGSGEYTVDNGSSLTLFALAVSNNNDVIPFGNEAFASDGAFILWEADVINEVSWDTFSVFDPDFNEVFLSSFGLFTDFFDAGDSVNLYWAAESDLINPGASVSNAFLFEPALLASSGVVFGNDGTTNSAIAVVSTVPVPAAVWLFGSGLLGLAGISRRKKA